MSDESRDYERPKAKKLSDAETDDVVGGVEVGRCHTGGTTTGSRRSGAQTIACEFGSVTGSCVAGVTAG